MLDLKCVNKVRQLFWKRELNGMQNSGIETSPSVLSPVHEWVFNGLPHQMTEKNCNISAFSNG